MDELDFAPQEEIIRTGEEICFGATTYYGLYCPIKDRLFICSEPRPGQNSLTWCIDFGTNRTFALDERRTFQSNIINDFMILADELREHIREQYQERHKNA
jgi:hypothetical protein